MAKSTPTGGGSGLNPSGAVGYSGLVNTQEEMPADYVPSIAYRNSRGKLVDPYGRRVENLGEFQEAGKSGTQAQKDSVSYAPTEEEQAEGETSTDSDKDDE